MAEYSQYSKVSPQWTSSPLKISKFEKKYTQLQNLDQVPVSRRREIFGEIERDEPTRQTPDDVKGDDVVRVREFSVAARDGYLIPVRSYVPSPPSTEGGSVVVEGKTRSRAVVVYLHAGGFLFGDLDSGHLNCRVLAVRLGVCVVNVGYRLAPRWKFPVGLSDCYDVVEWTAKHAESELSASPKSGFVVGGISSGANFAAVVAYQARDALLSPPITALWLSVPVGLMPQAYPLVPDEWRDQLRSLDQNAENPLLTRTSLAQIEELYGAPASDPRISFLLNPDHRNLPARVYIQICGRDPLRDEAFLWQKLVHRHSGTRSKIHLYAGLPHGFWRFLSMPVSLAWLDDLVEGVGFALGDGAGTMKTSVDGVGLNAGDEKEEGKEVEGALVVVKGL